MFIDKEIQIREYVAKKVLKKSKTGYFPTLFSRPISRNILE